MSVPAPSGRVALADQFHAQQLALNALGYRLFGLLSRALYAIYPTAAYVTVSYDSVDGGRYFELALRAYGAVVYDFAEHDGEPLPELTADLASQFGRYHPRDLRELQQLLNEACGTGAQLPYVPEHLEPHAAGATRCLLLNPTS